MFVHDERGEIRRRTKREVGHEGISESRRTKEKEKTIRRTARPKDERTARKRRGGGGEAGRRTERR